MKENEGEKSLTTNGIRKTACAQFCSSLDPTSYCVEMMNGYEYLMRKIIASEIFHNFHLVLFRCQRLHIPPLAFTGRSANTAADAIEMRARKRKY